MRRIMAVCKASNEATIFDADNPNLFVDVYEQEDGMLFNVRFDMNNIEGLITNKRPANEIVYDFMQLKDGDVMEFDKLYAVGDGGVDEEEDGSSSEDTEW